MLRDSLRADLLESITPKDMVERVDSALELAKASNELCQALRADLESWKGAEKGSEPSEASEVDRRAQTCHHVSTYLQVLMIYRYHYYNSLFESVRHMYKDLHRMPVGLDVQEIKELRRSVQEALQRVQVSVQHARCICRGE